MDQKNTAIPTTQSGNASQRDWLLVLLAITILPCVYYGERVGLVLGVSLLSAVVGTAAFRLIRGIRDIPDLSCLTVGMMVGLMLPVNVPLFIPALASLFAVCVCREAFGGQHYVFHPAAAGLALVTVLWPETVFSYYDMKAGGGVTLWEGVCTVTQSPAASLKKGIVSDLQPFDMLFGRYAGPMGATAAVVIVAGFLFLLVRRRIDFRMPLGMLLTASAVAWFWPRIPLSSLTSLKSELLGGGILFVLCFMVTDPVTAPKTKEGRFLLGLLGGFLLMGLQYGGAYEQEGVFAVLLLNALTPLTDQLVEKVKNRKGGDGHGEKPHRKKKSATETA